MSRRSRRNHSLAFNARVALDAAKDEQASAELSQRFDVQPSQNTQWKKQLLEKATSVFEGNKASEPPVDVKKLHAKIGELTLENDFLESALTH